MKNFFVILTALAVLGYLSLFLGGFGLALLGILVAAVVISLLLAQQQRLEALERKRDKLLAENPDAPDKPADD